MEAKLAKIFASFRLKPAYQYPISTYFLDFAFPEQRLAVECDEHQHNEPQQQDKDRKRDTYLQEHGWQVLRFSATDINDSPGYCINLVKIMLEICQKP